MTSRGLHLVLIGPADLVMCCQVAVFGSWRSRTSDVLAPTFGVVPSHVNAFSVAFSLL